MHFESFELESRSGTAHNRSNMRRRQLQASRRRPRGGPRRSSVDYLFAMTRPTILATALVLAATPRPSSQSATAPAAWMGHGISHELAVWRARTIREVRYDLTLDVSPLDSAIGRVTVRFVRLGMGDVVLDCRGRRFNSASARYCAPAPGRPTEAAAGFETNGCYRTPRSWSGR